ncbi:hypothetical protein Droror1_Dr00023269 [Drosera rotundifolia]
MALAMALVAARLLSQKGWSRFMQSWVPCHRHFYVTTFDSCGYACLGKEDQLTFGGITDLKKSNDGFIAEIVVTVPIVIEWTAADGDCNASWGSLSFACQGNTSFVNFDPGQGYRCFCLPGYEGNPYLAPGCTDIDESTSVYTYDCASTSICINPPGGYNCSCPEGQFGDGLSHGIGCIAFY